MGVIGHYEAVAAEHGTALLARACAALSERLCTTAVGPMDGNTWRRYRLVTERRSEPPFFLEPGNPEEWPEHWTRAGFAPCATYSSALNADLGVQDPRTDGSLLRLAAGGISVRALGREPADEDLGRIFALSTRVFRDNPFYGPIAEGEFRGQLRGLLPFLQPDLVLLAERGDDLVGFLFAVPDLLRTNPGGAPDTVILKTIAVDPSISGMGLGGVLFDLVQRAARRRGFHRAIHALMHDANRSRTISARYGRTMRRYALFSRPLPAPGP